MSQQEPGEGFKPPMAVRMVRVGRTGGDQEADDNGERVQDIRGVLEAVGDDGLGARAPADQDLGDGQRALMAIPAKAARSPSFSASTSIENSASAPGGWSLSCSSILKALHLKHNLSCAHKGEFAGASAWRS